MSRCVACALTCVGVVLVLIPLMDSYMWFCVCYLGGGCLWNTFFVSLLGLSCMDIYSCILPGMGTGGLFGFVQVRSLGCWLDVCSSAGWIGCSALARLNAGGENCGRFVRHLPCELGWYWVLGFVLYCVRALSLGFVLGLGRCSVDRRGSGSTIVCIPAFLGVVFGCFRVFECCVRALVWAVFWVCFERRGVRQHGASGSTIVLIPAFPGVAFIVLCIRALCSGFGFGLYFGFV